MTNDLMAKIVSLCKRRGFIYPGSEIYGGLANTWDYGPLGVELKNNIKRAWWDEMIKKHDNIVGLDAAIIMSPKVWEASGHLTAGFADELLECKECHQRFRIDDLEEAKKRTEDQGNLDDKITRSITKKMTEKYWCPNCGGELSSPRKFNLMMKTFIGPVENETDITYLRAETCQGIYMNFKNVLDSMRLKIPFGIAQIGKAFRNEITPKDFIFRTREFEQMEMQWFCHPKETDKWFTYWKEERMKWYLYFGIKKEKIRFREHKKEELAHYAKKAVDIEYEFPFGWKEIEGIHNRGDWDLSNHSKYSGEDLSYYNRETKEKYIPHIIETSEGVDRSVLVILLEAYSEEKDRVVLKIPPKLAPYKVAVFPLLANKPQLVKKASEIYEMLKSPITQLPNYPITVAFDDRGNIGKRYYSQDEIGTVLAVTVDFQTLEDKTITLRDRDTTQQIRIPIIELQETIQKIIAGEKFLKFGKLVK